MKKNNLLYQIKSLEKMIVRNLLGDNEIEKREEQANVMQLPTPTQMQIIEYILNHTSEDIYQRDLEDILNLRRATVSGVLHTMEKNNLIRRVTDNEDTRSKKILLNNKAKEIFLQNQKKMDKTEQTITQNIPKEDLEVFSRVIQMMKNNMKNQNN
ncbi:MAG TPA: MarR family winged helix-turn-helix transcriptional regulator [Clostridiaceae bacterium]|jgi:MarR family transcriptional repressor of mepA|nr:MarR family winged helix-turn-helix transcriptional regulator [Clostridiaceae bacterium]